VHFIPNAVDMERYDPPTVHERHCSRHALGLESDAVVCLFVGRLSREKGVLDLIEAWNSLQPVNASLLIAGPDMPGHPWNAGPAARQLVTRHRLGASVRFLGPCDDVASLLHVADVVVQPSHFEALGLSAIEALASGVPVVASAVGGLLDFVVDGVNGRLAPPHNPAALASILRDVLVDATLRERLAAAARTSVAEYGEQAVFSRMVDLLGTIASANRQ
jgi:UDP-glucose:(heptosyl)LPS alpha-1,3-glucosyltransferase